jgi:hypothetical protein
MAIDGVAELFSEQFTLQFPPHDTIEMTCIPKPQLRRLEPEARAMLPKLAIYVARRNDGKNLDKQPENILWLEVLHHGGLYRGRIGHTVMTRLVSLQAKHPADRGLAEAVLLSASTTAPSTCEFVRGERRSQPVG